MLKFLKFIQQIDLIIRTITELKKHNIDPEKLDKQLERAETMPVLVFENDDFEKRSGYCFAKKVFHRMAVENRTLLWKSLWIMRKTCIFVPFFAFFRPFMQKTCGKLFASLSIFVFLILSQFFLFSI